MQITTPPLQVYRVERAQAVPAGGGSPPAESGRSEIRAGDRLVGMVHRARTAPLPGGLTVEDASVRAATVYGGWKAAKGVVVTGDAVAGLCQHDIYLALTQQDLLKLSPQSAEEAARWIKDVTSSGVVRYLFIGVGGGVLTFAVLRAVNPKMPVGRALLIAVGVVVGLVALLLILEAKGVLVAP